MSYVANGGITYDNDGYAINAAGARIGGRDPFVSENLKLGVTAPNNVVSDAVLAAAGIARRNPAAMSSAPVMKGAPVIAKKQTVAQQLPIGLIALAIGAYYFWKHA